jgi:hypothetical protein
MSKALKVFNGLTEWEDVIKVMRQLRQRKRIIQVGEQEFGNSKTLTRTLKISFRGRVCRFNRERKIDEPIRGIYSGEFVKVGSWEYARTIRICRISRMYSTCAEIKSQDVFPHPRTGAPVLRNSLTGKKLIRGCR